ncbi:MAG: ABC transporter ATP-binding protein [Spirobacillus cienkowskii]|jgi:ATPase subunit of ABC transporter with duplicated ATPase domains|uniref:ABC transporter ATP-binding protein n=1 Tax=Spirobacillus cienkowskii TaxID=495820 RepID=A0A369KTN6_9BACT|nr:MAG: ABC transporter ATP-binding protein [Spirobacillus cienkowskii]
MVLTEKKNNHIKHQGIIISDLSFSWPDGTQVFHKLNTQFGNNKIALIGQNGAGKSTLLRLIVGEIKLSSGSIQRSGKIGYLPQNLLNFHSTSIMQLFGVEKEIAALKDISQGNCSQELFNILDNKWDIEDRIFAFLAKRNLSHINLSRTIKSLSGGEALRIYVAALEFKGAEFLVLDEPTNNLDTNALQDVIEMLLAWKKGALIVSHDPVLLNIVDQCAELFLGKIRIYGGNFALYQEQRQLENSAANRTYQDAEKELQIRKQQETRAHEISARRSSNAKKNQSSLGLPKVAINFFKNNSEKSAGKSNELHQQKVDEAQDRLHEAKQNLRNEERIVIDLPDTLVHDHKKILNIKSVTFSYSAESKLFHQKEINFSVFGPERIAIQGTNGSGKSTLLALIAGEIQPQSGIIERGTEHIGYVDQRLMGVNPDLSVYDNVATKAPNLSESEIRIKLGRFLFRNQRAFLPVHALSGGEKFRALLATILNTQPAPQLLLLDEPTNNLDLTSIKQLEDAICAFRGSLIVVSHNSAFLENIGITRYIKIDEFK